MELNEEDNFKEIELGRMFDYVLVTSYSQDVRNLDIDVMEAHVSSLCSILRVFDSWYQAVKPKTCLTAMTYIKLRHVSSVNRVPDSCDARVQLLVAWQLVSSCQTGFLSPHISPRLQLLCARLSPGPSESVISDSGAVQGLDQW